MNCQRRVVVTDFIHGPLEPEKRILGDIAVVEALGATSERDLVGRIESADAIMVYHDLAITQQTISRLNGCRLIVRCGVGYDNVDAAAAAERGIAVANVPDYGTEDVADSAIGLLLAMSRGIAFYNSRLRDGLGPWAYTQFVPRHRLRGQVFGIVGLGRIGSATALRAKALGMDVAFYDPYKPDGYDKALGIRRVEDLPGLLAESHVLSLHCPLTEETRHLIDAAALAQLPARSYLVNTARGGIVDPAAVVDAITSEHLQGAGIDVLETEPADESNPLVRAWRDPSHPAHDRVIINPHAAFYSEEGLIDMRIKGAEACRRALLGQPLRNVVNTPQTPPSRNIMPKLIDLSFPLEQGQLNFPFDPKISVLVHNTVSSIGYNMTQISMGTHQGTHLDAPFHFYDDGKTVDQIPLDRFYGPAVLVDLAPGSHLKAKTPITPAMFEPFADRFQPGAKIIYRTGWDRAFGTPEYFSDFPSLTIEGAQWLAERRIGLIGMDTPTPGTDWKEVHLVLLAEGVEIVIVEGLTGLDRLPERFTLSTLPLNIKGRDGAPCRAVAILD